MLLYVHMQKPYGLLGTGAQDGHLDFHTAPELCFQPFFFFFRLALRPQEPLTAGLLGTGDRGIGYL